MIITNNTSTALVPFGTLCNGDVFIYDEAVYMATETVEDCFGDSCNALRMEWGELYRIELDELVQPVNAELVLTNKE